MKRRRFSKLVGGAAAASAFPSVLIRNRGVSDRLVLTGGTIFDGSGRPAYEGDLGINGDRIVAVGPSLPRSGAEVVDVRGMAIAPGFIDIHSHTDLSLLVNPNAESKIRQGVTTEVTGQDGSSILWTEDAYESIRDRYASQYNVEIDFKSLPGFFDRLTRDRPSVNLASMVGAGSVRAAVIGNAQREPSATELQSMEHLVSQQRRAGACGISSGLEYVPGAFASPAELTAVARVFTDTGLPYATHMRNEDDTVFAAVEEALHVGRMTGVPGIPIHISHLKALGVRNWWKVPEILSTLEAAAADGLNVTFDRYPYVAYSTTLASLFPVWAREGSTDEFIGRLNNPETAIRIETEVRAKIDRLGNWDSVQMTSASDDSLQWVNGRKLGQLAVERGEEPYELLEHIITADRNRTGMVGFGMSEENTERLLSHPMGMICSDAGARATYGPLSEGSPHPRAYGSFPRVLGHYCRDRNIMPLETAIHKMTGMPASLIRLADRGSITEGAFADIVVFRPETVADKATFENPHRYPVGIDLVFVNGKLVVREGEHTGARAGRVLRPSQDN